MIWRLQADLVHLKNGKLLVKGKNDFLLKDPPKKLILLLENLENGIEQKQFFQLKSNSSTKKLIEQLIKNGLVRQESLEYEGTFLEKSYRYFNFNHDGIDEFRFNSNASIAILGCGGIGANIAFHLATSGFLKFTLVDFDTVDETNLNRQFPFDRNQIGETKTNALEKKLKLLNSKIEICSKKIKVDSLETLRNIFEEKPDLIVCGVDIPPILAQLWVAKFSLEKEIVSLFGSVGNNILSLGPFLITKKAHNNFISKLEDIYSSIKNQVKPCDYSISTTNSMASSIMSNEILIYFYGTNEPLTKDKRIIFDTSYLKELERINYG